MLYHACWVLCREREFVAFLILNLLEHLNDMEAEFQRMGGDIDGVNYESPLLKK